MLKLDERIGIKALTQLVIDEIGSQDRCVEVSGRLKRRGTFGEYADERAPGLVIPYDIAASLDRYLLSRSKPAMFLDRMAELLGHVAVPLPPATMSGTPPLGRITGQAMHDVSEIFAALGKAIDDGRISAAEDLEVEQLITVGIKRLLTLQAEVRVAAGRTVLP